MVRHNTIAQEKIRPRVRVYRKQSVGRFGQSGRARRKNERISCRRHRRPMERLRYKIYVGAGNVSRENDASKDGNVVVFHIRMRVFSTRRLSLVRVEFFAVGK